MSTANATRTAEAPIPAAASRPPCGALPLRAAGYFPRGAEVVGLPPWPKPKIYVMGHGSARARWNQNCYPAHRTGARLARLVVRCLHAAGLRCGTWRAEAEWLIPAFLEGLDLDVRYVNVLTANSAGRFTLELRDRAGRVVGYLKHATTSQGMARLAGEYQALRRLPPGLGPAPLRCCELGTGLGLLTAPVAGRPWRPVLPPDPEIGAYLSRLARGEDLIDPRRYWEGISEPCLVPCVEALAKRDWAAVVEHGDFAPWNLFQRPSGELIAIDWEYAELRGFPCLDYAHYVLQTAALIKRAAPAQALITAVSLLCGIQEYRLSTREACAIARLAAYSAYQRSSADLAPATHHLQRWRRELWLCNGPEGC